LCAKVAKYLDRVYSPDRVMYPMRRIAPKGRGVTGTHDVANIFERISWNDAYEEIASRLRSISDQFGPEAILPYSYAGTTAVLSYGSMDRRFFHRLGASQLDRTICSTAGGEALVSVLGRKVGTDTELFANAKYIIAWGANVHGNNVHLWPFIEKARHNGAKLVVIDPYKTRTAKCADWYLPINPGTDVALAMGMMHVIVAENLHDSDYVAKYTTGFDELRNRLHGYPPHRVAEWTGIAAADIVKLAR
jgi:anaerobic selenocysteine-containing dehydrogenase